MMPSAASRDPKDTTTNEDVTIKVNDTPGSPKEIPFGEADPRASAYSILSSSSSSSSDQRMSMQSNASSLEVDGLDDVEDDDDEFDDDVWVSRRFTMVLSPDAIKAFSSISSFSRSTSYVPPSAKISSLNVGPSPVKRAPSPNPTRESSREKLLSREPSNNRLKEPKKLTTETSKTQLISPRSPQPKQQSPREQPKEQVPLEPKEISPRAEISPRTETSPRAESAVQPPKDQPAEPLKVSIELPKEEPAPTAQVESESTEQQPAEPPKEQPAEQPAEQPKEEPAKEQPKDVPQENGRLASNKLRAATLRPSVTPRVNPPSTRLSQIVPGTAPLPANPAPRGISQAPTSPTTATPATPTSPTATTPATPTSPTATATPATPATPTSPTSTLSPTTSSVNRPGSAIVTRGHSHTVSTVSPRVSLPPTSSTPTSPTQNFTTPVVGVSTTASATATAASTTKRPPTAPRSSSNRSFIGSPPSLTSPTSPTSESPVSPTSPASPTSLTSPISPTFPVSPAAANLPAGRNAHIPPKKALPPNPTKVKSPRKASYTKEEQEKAARVIQGHYRLYRGRRVHQQAVAVYRLRSHIANEIVNTERTYVAVLRHVVTRYYEPLSRNMAAIGIENEDVKVIFGSLPVLLNVNSNLLKALEDRMDKWSATQCLGDLFVNMAAYLKSYTEYVKNFDLALRKIAKCSKNPQFEAFLLAAEDIEERTVTLESYLITPVQRIPRYVLLLQQMHDHTPPTHVDYASLGKALSLMRDVAMYINEKKREADNALRVVEIQSLLTGKGLPRMLLEHYSNYHKMWRRFCKEGEIYIHVNKKGGKIKKKRFVFLFNDILVLTKPTIVQTIFTKKKKYRFKFFISLNQAELTEATMPESTFTIASNGYAWMFGADTEELKQQWVTALKNCIEILRSSSVKFEERVSKISKQKAGAARAAITKQYTTMRVNEPKERKPSAASLHTQLGGNAPSPASQNCPPPNMTNLKHIPYLELDDKELAEIESMGGDTNTGSQRRLLTDAVSRWLRISKDKDKDKEKDKPTPTKEPKPATAPSDGKKKSKSIIDIMTLKSILMVELLEKVTSAPPKQ